MRFDYHSMLDSLPHCPMCNAAVESIGEDQVIWKCGLRLTHRIDDCDVIAERGPWVVYEGCKEAARAILSVIHNRNDETGIS